MFRWFFFKTFEDFFSYNSEVLEAAPRDNLSRHRLPNTQRRNCWRSRRFSRRISRLSQPTSALPKTNCRLKLVSRTPTLHEASTDRRRRWSVHGATVTRQKRRWRREPTKLWKWLRVKALSVYLSTTIDYFLTFPMHVNVFGVALNKLVISQQNRHRKRFSSCSGETDWQMKCSICKDLFFCFSHLHNGLTEIEKFSLTWLVFVDTWMINEMINCDDKSRAIKVPSAPLNQANVKQTRVAQIHNKLI